MFNNLLALYRSLYDRSYHYLFYEENNTIVKRQSIDNESRLQKFINFIDYPVNLIDNIYIGSAYNAANFNLLTDLNIGLIINVTKEIQNYFPENFEYINIQVSDTNNESLKNNFHEIVEKINNFTKFSDKKVLVHCYMGASRSATIILAYMLNKNISLNTSLKIIVKKKKSINVNTTFYNELKDYSINLSLKKILELQKKIKIINLKRIIFLWKKNYNL